MTRALARVAVASVALVSLVVAGHLVTTRTRWPAAPKTAATSAPAPIPTLYCEFYNFMRNGTVVSFLFAAERASGDERHFREMAVVEPDGTRTEYDADAWPQWTRGSDDGTPTIASPDGATRIVLYGFKPQAGGTFWTEAGIRSNTYKNLEGKCRQAGFGTTQG